MRWEKIQRIIITKSDSFSLLLCARLGFHLVPVADSFIMHPILMANNTVAVAEKAHTVRIQPDVACSIIECNVIHLPDEIPSASFTVDVDYECHTI